MITTQRIITLFVFIQLFWIHTHIASGIETVKQNTIKPIYLYTNPVESDTSETQSIAFHSLNYILPSEAVTQLKPLFPKLHFIPNDEQKLITFTARETTHATITKILHKWDQPTHQIRFHTHIYEISETVLKNSQGLLSGLIDPISISHTIGSSTVTPLNSIISHLQFLESTGEASLVAHPMIVTGLLNQAEIKIGDKIPYESSVSNGNLLTYHMSQMDTGIHLTITPKLINETQAILTDLDLKIESVKVWKQLQHSDFPILSKRWVKSTVTLQNETPFIIAGLTETSHKENTSMPTFLKKIPLLSHRKKNNITSTDLLIIIYPEILSSNAF